MSRVSVNWASRRGWVRIWVLASAIWILFASFSLIPQISGVGYSDVATRNVYGSSEIENTRKKVIAEVSGICLDSSINTVIQPDPLPPEIVPISKEQRIQQEMLKFGVERDMATLSVGMKDKYPNRYEIEKKSADDYNNIVRSKRIKIGDYHTHVIVVTCKKIRDIAKYNLYNIYILFIIPILFYAFAVVFVFLIKKIFSWLGDGFRSDGASIPAPKNIVTEAAPPAKMGRVDGQRTSAVKWILTVVGFIIVTIFAKGLASVMGENLSFDKNSHNNESVNKFINEIRGKLPINVGSDIWAVNVDIDDNGLIWTYKAKSSHDLVDKYKYVTYLADLRKKACQSSAVQDIVKNGFYVRYNLVNAADEPLGSETISSC